LHRTTGQHFTTKDFRTWGGTTMAARAFQEFEPYESQSEAKRNIVRAVEAVAERLGNSKAVCRKCYIHPAVFDAYLNGSLPDSMSQPAKKLNGRSRDSLKPEEAAVMKLMQRRSTRKRGHAKPA